MKIFAALALAAILCGCAGKSDDKPVEIPAAVAAENPAAVRDAFVILPGNFIIDVGAGANVLLNPAVQEFTIWPTARQANEALKSAKENWPPQWDWRVYRLEGEFAELSRACGPDRFCLARPALVVEWL